MRNKKYFAFAAACMLSTTVLFTGCSSEKSSAPALTDGTYEATSAGLQSDVAVSITVEGGVITACTIDASGETENLGTLVPDTMEGEVVEKNGVDVQAVSGATVTSDAALAALEDCLTQAGK